MRLNFFLKNESGIKKSTLDSKPIENYLHFLEIPMKIAGCWDWYPNTQSEYQIMLNNVYYCMVLFVLINVPATLFVHLSTEWTDVMTSLGKMADCLPYVVSIVIVVYFGLYRREMYDLVKFMNDNFKFRSANGLTNMTMVGSYKAAKNFGYLYTACTMFSISMYVMPDLVSWWSNEPLKNYMYMDVTSSPLFVIKFLNIYWSQALVGLALGQLGVFFAANAILLCGQLDVVCCSLRNARYTALLRAGVHYRKYPVWDVARPTPQVLMEQARRDLMEADQKLAAKREEEAKYRQLMDAKWQELRNKEMLLKESFISFNKFIRENQEKRDRAERKTEADSEALERKTRETEAMRQRVQEMEQVRQLMEQQVKDYTIYEDYLMAVVQAYPEFKQPLDVLNRYEALAAAKSSLAERQERDLELLEAARRDIAALTDDKKLFIMGLNNTLADLRWQYDKVRNRVIKWELALNRLKETAAQRQAQLARVRAALWALYRKICRHKGLPVDVQADDFEQQLVVIMRALLELRRIYRIAQRRSKEKDAESNQTA